MLVVIMTLIMLIRAASTMTRYSIVVGVNVPGGGLDQHLPIGSATT